MTSPVGLAPYASKPEESRGRLHPEPEHAMRSPFQRDRDRIIHSTAFRRLTHKTQVFVYHEGDHYRTRLTHTLEVAQIARTISRALGLDEDLAETLALAHDLGHTPFGHAGEEALNAEMARFGGFSHNDQTLRILTHLERRYAEFDGLNPTWEALEGTVKHNGPLRGPGIDRAVPPSIAEYDRRHPLWLDSFPSAEAQVAALADDIAYNNHDIDDGLRAGLFAIADLADVPLVGPVFRDVESRYPALEEARLIHETIRRLIDRMVSDLIGETSKRLAAGAVRSADEVRLLKAPVVGFSDEMSRNDRALKEFLFERMYRHYRVNRMSSKARRVIHDLFSLYLAEPQCLPREWRENAGGPDEPQTARVAADYLAGMTDRFALDEHHRLFDTYART
jgi:dGTPase